jgi:hypothetical protein
MKNNNSIIKEIFHLFIGYKILEIILSLIILCITYKFFPQPFKFYINLIEQFIK